MGEFTFILMEKNAEGILEREVGSYSISLGEEYLLSAYMQNNQVHFDISSGSMTADWQYEAILDNFDLTIFSRADFMVYAAEIDGYNPTWHLFFDYCDNEMQMTHKIDTIFKLFEEEMINVMDTIEDLEEEYSNLS